MCFVKVTTMKNRELLYFVPNLIPKTTKGSRTEFFQAVGKLGQSKPSPKLGQYILYLNFDQS
jgi:hypothetical protein